MQSDTVPGMAHFSTAGRGSIVPFNTEPLNLYCFQERRWDIKVTFDSGSVWLLADEAGSTSTNFEDPSKMPLVLGGTGYYRQDMS